MEVNIFIMPIFGKKCVAIYNIMPTLIDEFKIQPLIDYKYHQFMNFEATRCILPNMKDLKCIDSYLNGYGLMCINEGPKLRIKCVHE
uniref:Uncharacterized protein n=1 Tax=viral metagenome TaxID=1070528 RepID=A0A6C0LTM1_9ZZZZ